MLYLVGGGYSPQSAINIGMGERGGDVLHQDVTLAQLRQPGALAAPDGV